MATIKKADLAEKAKKAANATPGIEERLAHARSLTHAHPAPDHSHNPVNEVFNNRGTSESARLVPVPVDLIDPNPVNARKIYRPERVSELAVSIGAHGQDVPGIATLRENGRYILAAGHYRLRAIKVLGLKTMDLMLHDGLTDKDLFAFSYRENAEREGQSALDNALCWKELLNQKVYANETELAEVTGMSLPNINKTLRILQLSDPILDIIKEDPSVFPLSALYELALFESVGTQAAALDLVMKIKAGEAGRKDIQEARAKVENPKARKRKETSRPYKIQREGAVIGTLKVWDSGRVMLDVVLPESEEREGVLADLKRKFGVNG